MAAKLQVKFHLMKLKMQESERPIKVLIVSLRILPFFIQVTIVKVVQASLVASCHGAEPSEVQTLSSLALASQQNRTLHSSGGR